MRKFEMSFTRDITETATVTVEFDPEDYIDELREDAIREIVIERAMQKASDDVDLMWHPDAVSPKADPHYNDGPEEVAV